VTEELFTVALQQVFLYNYFIQDINLKHNNLIRKIFLWQHVSTILSDHQAFQRTDPIYQNL